MRPEIYLRGGFWADICGTQNMEVSTMVSKQKVLIVDDDNNIAELIALYLTKECYETMIVNDGESVMPAMESFFPNLILLDIMLPGV